MQKKYKILPLLCAALLLVGCGKETNDQPVEQVQQKYGQMNQGSATWQVTADSGVLMEYTLAGQWSQGQMLVTVQEPQEIAGVQCTLGQTSAQLQYEGAQLETLLPPLPGFTPVDCLQGLLESLAGAAPSEWNREKWQDTPCLVLTYELELEGQQATKRIWLQEESLEPVYGEWFLEGDRILHASFGDFIGDSAPQE